MKKCVILTSKTRFAWNLLHKLLERGFYFVFLDEMRLVNEDEFYQSETFQQQECVLRSDFKSLKNSKNINFYLHSLMQIDFKQTNIFYLIAKNAEFEFFKELLEKMGLDDRRLEFLDSTNNSDEIADFLINANLQLPNAPLKTPKKYHFTTNAKMVICQSYQSILFVDNQEVLCTSFELPKRLMPQNKRTKSKFAKKLDKLRRNPRLFVRDFILKRI